ncbi:MAG: YfcE family phosphodiesterase [Clostridia bacterium]|nr:YfcE family phosphodiesterase [Clostridia bacterium]
MKCLCFSDSHGDTYNIRRALSMHPDAEVVFFLGDGLSDLEHFVNDRSRAFLAVRGNWDISAIFGDSFVKNVDMITLLGHRIVFTHGNNYGVKSGINGIVELARDKNADLVLFGHTHLPFEKYIPDVNRGIYLFNPGSIGGRRPAGASYGVINITEQGILFSHGTL